MFSNFFPLRLNMLVSDVQAAMFSSRRLSNLDRKSSAALSFTVSERKSSYLSSATLPFYRAESVIDISKKKKKKEKKKYGKRIRKYLNPC